MNLFIWWFKSYHTVYLFLIKRPSKPFKRVGTGATNQWWNGLNTPGRRRTAQSSNPLRGHSPTVVCWAVCFSAHSCSTMTNVRKRFGEPREMCAALWAIHPPDSSLLYDLTQDCFVTRLVPLPESNGAQRALRSWSLSCCPLALQQFCYFLVNSLVLCRVCMVALITGHS